VLRHCLLTGYWVLRHRLLTG